MKRHSTAFSVYGFLLGIAAPVGWTAIRILFFYDANQTFLGQVFSAHFSSLIQFTMYPYMGVGTALVLSTLGYLIGRNGDELRERAVELSGLH